MQNTISISEKPTFVQLLNRHHVNMVRLARTACIHVDIVRAIAQCVPVQPIVAQAVLHGLFLLTGVFYRLEDVDVALVPPSYIVGSIHVRREDLEACHAITTDGR